MVDCVGCGSDLVEETGDRLALGWVVMSSKSDPGGRRVCGDARLWYPTYVQFLLVKGAYRCDILTLPTSTIY